MEGIFDGALITHLLPHEVQLSIFSFLDPHSLCNCACVNKSWREMADDFSIWKECYRLRWKTVDLPEFCIQGRSWKAIFRDRYQMEKTHLEQKDVDADYKSESQRYVTYGDIFRHKVRDGQPAEETDILFCIASEQYSSALALEPNNFVGLNNFGLALTHFGKHKDGIKSETLFRLACKKYEQALSYMDSSKEIVMRHWADALHYFARKKQGPEAEELLLQSCAKYQESVAAKPTYATAYDYWGLALHHRAKLKTGEEAEMLYTEAYDKYQRGHQLSSTDEILLCHWAATLHDHAKIKEKEESELYLHKAREKYAEAHALNSRDEFILRQWGDVHRDIARLKEGEEADQWFGLAYEKYDAAIAIKPRYNICLNNWGLALSNHAKLKEGEDANKLFELSCQKLAAAVELDPKDDIAINNWALALSFHAGTKEGEAADEMFRLSCEKYAQALAIKHDDHIVSCNWAMTLVSQAKKKTGEEKERILDDAERRLMRIADLGDTWGYFCMARLSSVRGREEECKRWLMASKDKDYLAKAAKSQMVDFDNVQHCAWFQALLKKKD